MGELVPVQTWRQMGKLVSVQTWRQVGELVKHISQGTSRQFCAQLIWVGPIENFEAKILVFLFALHNSGSWMTKKSEYCKLVSAGYSLFLFKRQSAPSVLSR